EQEQGTLETLLVAPRDPRLLLVCGAVWPFLFATAQLVVYLVLGVVLFSADLPLDRIVLAGGMTLLTILVFSSLGLAAAAVIVVTKRVGPLLAMASAVFALFGGVLYPISVLPGPLRIIARMLPMSYGLEGVRLSFVDDLPAGAITRDAIVLVVASAVLIPLALQLFEWGVNRARRTGSLAQY
ncbi:MAG: ABC transporter permease, partial [Actinobacteria bacterium]|nr:ABC transporter permease [Actinomycetota bacterium]